MSEPTNEMGAGGVAGFQVPMGIRRRKKNVDELLSLNPDIDEGHTLSFFSSLDEPGGEDVGKSLEALDYNGVADKIRMHAVRELVKKRVKEVVRKKPGGGYVLYSPNQGKKHPAKAAGSFPTKLGAKRAELSRFPPRDPKKAKRLRKEIDRLVGDPKKRAAQAQRDVKKGKKESVEPPLPGDLAERIVLARALVGDIRKAFFLGEALFREERTGSEWDDYISRLSGKALTGDRKFQKLQQGIEKRTASILQDAFRAVAKAIKKEATKVKDHGIKRSDEKGKTYLAFGATFDNVAVEPIYIYIEAGVPKIEVSDQARVALTKVDPGNSKLFRAELITVQERVLDRMEDLSKAIESRDRYLERVEEEVDSFVAGLTPLQVSMLKNLLTKKYRKP